MKKTEKHITESSKKKLNRVMSKEDKIYEEERKRREEEDKIYEEERKRREEEEKLRYQKYRASLKPVSKEEFKKRFEKLTKRYAKYLNDRLNEEILFVSLNLNLTRVLVNALEIKDPIDLAELIDSAEGIMDTLEMMMRDAKKRNDELEEAIQKIKKEKER